MCPCARRRLSPGRPSRGLLLGFLHLRCVELEEMFEAFGVRPKSPANVDVLDKRIVRLMGCMKLLWHGVGVVEFGNRHWMLFVSRFHNRPRTLTHPVLFLHRERRRR